MAPTNGNVKKFISQERVWLSEVRTEMNKLFDKYLSRLDEMEVRVQKELEVTQFAENCKPLANVTQTQPLQAGSWGLGNETKP